MNYSWIEDINKFQDIRDEWDRKLIESGDYNPFLLSDFIITWWRYYKNGSKLRIFIIYDKNEIAGGIPLYLKRSGLREGFLRILYHVGDVAANYTQPMYVSREIKLLPALMDALTEKKDWDVLRLRHVQAKNNLISEYHNNTSNRRFILFTIQDHMNWAIDLSVGRDNYMHTLSKKLARDLRAKRKHAVERYGNLHLREIKGEKEVKHYFDLFVNFSLQAFDSRKRSSAFKDKKYSAFLKEFLVIMDRADRLDAHVLMGGDKVLAISFAYRFGKGFNWVLTGFDYEARYVRPGYLLIEELINEICNRGETYYNWYGHSRFYKTQWCNRKTPLFQFFLIKRTLSGLCYKTLKEVETALRSKQ